LYGLNWSRCSLEHVRHTVTWLRRLSLPGISTRLKRLHISSQRGRQHLTSPDPLYEQKLEAIAQARMLCLGLPERFVFLYEHEQTSGRQPSASRAYARRGGPSPKALQAARSWTKRRIAGCLDVQTGALISRERSRFNVRELTAFLLLVEKPYPPAERIDMALDKGPVHFHGYVLDTLREQHSRISLLPGPTYAPWTNPIEKGWSKCKQELFHLHPGGADCQHLRPEVTRWLQAAPRVGTGAVEMG